MWLRSRLRASIPRWCYVQSSPIDDDEMLLAVMTMFLVGPTFMLAWALQFVPWKQVNFGIVETLFVLAAMGLFGWGLRSFIRHAGARRKAREGLAAERMTAQELNRLIGSGCQVLHDVPGEGSILSIGESTGYHARYAGQA